MTGAVVHYVMGGSWPSPMRFVETGARAGAAWTCGRAEPMPDARAAVRRLLALRIIVMVVLGSGDPVGSVEC
jgi:hypothetical protein